MQFSEAIMEYSFDCKIRKLSAKTIENYQKQLRYMRSFRLYKAVSNVSRSSGMSNSRTAPSIIIRISASVPPAFHIKFSICLPSKGGALQPLCVQYVRNCLVGPTRRADYHFAVISQNFQPTLDICCVVSETSGGFKASEIDKGRGSNFGNQFFLAVSL